MVKNFIIKVEEIFEKIEKHFTFSIIYDKIFKTKHNKNV